MTIASLVNRVTYSGTGSSGPYTASFRVFALADILVTRRAASGLETTLSHGKDYAVQGVSNSAFSVTLTTALAVGEKLTIRRAPLLTQPTSIQNQSAYVAKTHEDEFDRLAMQLQSVQDGVDRSIGVPETYDPSSVSLRVRPEPGKALVWQSATELGNSALDAGATAVPGAGRTVGSISAYLLNNSVFNVKDYGATGDGLTNDTVAVRKAIAAANASVGREGGFKSQVGAILYIPRGTYRLTEQLTPYPGVSMVGEGLWNTVLLFALPSTKHAIVWDGAMAGYPAYQGHGWGGTMRDIKVTTVDFSDVNASCDTMVRIIGMIDFSLCRVMLAQSRGRLLHLENVISVTLDHVSLQQCKGDAGLWIGSAGSISTTVRGFGVYVSQCERGPNVDVGGLSIDFFGLISESAGAKGTQAGSYGVRIRSGRCALYSPYFEDNADHDVYVGSDVVAGVTSVIIDNPTIMSGPNKVALKGGVYLDKVSYASIRGGDYSAVSRPLQMTVNCAQVDASYYPRVGKPPLLTSGAHWRTKADLNYTTGPDRSELPQTLTKDVIAPGRTATLTIPLLPASSAFLSVYARVQFLASGDRQALVKIDAAHHSDGFVDGGAIVTVLRANNGGNFLVSPGDFVTTFTPTSVRITYTSSNPATNNAIQFWADGVGIGGDISIA
jgi:hypothetical protein